MFLKVVGTTVVFCVVLEFEKQEKVQGLVCVFNAVCIFEYGLCMFCVACMICANDVGVQFAIALLLMSETRN